MGSLFWRIFLLVLLGVMGGLPSVAQTARPLTRIPRVTRPPKLEDFLKGSPREAEAIITDFRQYQPGDGIPLSQKTTAYLSYDDRNLYVAFVCEDEPGKMRARMAKREDVFSDDAVGVYLDAFHDHHRAYFFYVNPLGIQTDGIQTEGQGGDVSFDTLWYSEGRLTPWGYVAWMAIPFKSLRFPNAPKQTWGIALTRTIVRTNEVSFWPYVTKRAEGLVQQFATLEGLEHISPGRNVQLIPYGVFARARFLDTREANNLRFRTQNDFRGGLDAKFVVKDALTFDVALNPDFSQVESDEPQVTINQRFEVFFPEKRPFFIENAGFFQTPIPLFFSRRIVDPQFGVRMTGKVGRWALGALGMDDRKPGGAAFESAPRGRAGIGVVHVVREFSQQSKIGVFISSRDAGPTYNRVVSLDTRIKLSPNLVLEGQAMKSFARQNPDSPDCLKGGQRLAGPAYFAELLFLGRHLSYDVRYSDRSPNFCSELGFVPRVDIRDAEYFVDYTWRPEHRRLVSFGPSLFVLVNWNRAGQLQDRIVNYKFGATFTGQTAVEIRRVETFELFQGIGFRKHRASLRFSTEWLRWLSAFADYSVGSSENFFPGPGMPSFSTNPPPPLSPFLASATSADAGFTLRPSPRIRFDQTYIFSRLTTREGSTPAGFASGTSIFSNHILRSKLNYQFNKELSLRAILDYSAVLSNPQLVALERSKRVTTDFLFTYLLNPGTALYVGYTDRYENLSLDPGMPPGVPASLSRTGSPTHSTGRQFFIKMSYLLRF
ncbi:MAG: carbohydrate binding family 9 domain-containing protein [Acidobacteria bacterium]|nr:carbohydrate binding family 9 domain-containing protein [Acidobacteriota bacterium]